MAQPPNIILIISDQLRHDQLGCTGHPAAITPNLDRLATTGTLFANCYATNPVCLPSRSSMATGKYVHHHHCHLNSQVIARDETCFPALLRDTGYFTAVIGKLHLWEGWVKPCHADVGFQLRNTVEGKYSLNSRVEESGLYFDYLRDQGLPLPYQFPQRDPAYEHQLHARVSEYRDKDYIDTFLTTRAIRVIEDSGRRPFMMQLGICSPHEFYDPPQEYLDLYAGAEIPAPLHSPAAIAAKSPAFRQFQQDIAARCDLPLAEWDDQTVARIKRMRRHYLATVTCVDRQVGRVVDALKRKGIYDHTAIIFVADHGEFNGDHGCVDKHLFLYECNLHVPMIIHAPFLAAGGQRCDSLVQNLDLFATILDLAGVTAPPASYSRSLIPALGDPRATVRHAAFAECYDRVMIRRDRFKLIVDHEFTELYDLANDPNEQVNLAYDTSRDALTDNPEILARIVALQREIDFWRVHTEPGKDLSAGRTNPAYVPFLRQPQQRDDEEA